MNPSTRKRGFTLVELLVVVAIIAVLAAIAIPTFGGALNKARRATDDANEHTALTLASIHYQTEAKSDTLYYVFRMSEEGLVPEVIYTEKPSHALDGYNEYVDDSDGRTARHAAGLVVAIEAGKAPVASWMPAQ